MYFVLIRNFILFLFHFRKNICKSTLFSIPILLTHYSLFYRMMIRYAVKGDKDVHKMFLCDFQKSKISEVHVNLKFTVSATLQSKSVVIKELPSNTMPIQRSYFTAGKFKINSLQSHEYEESKIAIGPFQDMTTVNVKRQELESLLENTGAGTGGKTKAPMGVQDQPDMDVDNDEEKVDDADSEENDGEGGTKTVSAVNKPEKCHDFVKTFMVTQEFDESEEYSPNQIRSAMNKFVNDQRKENPDKINVKPANSGDEINKKIFKIIFPRIIKICMYVFR